MSVTIEFSAHYFGDDARPGFTATAEEVELDTNASVETAVDASRDPVTVKVYGIAANELDAMQGTKWTRVRFTDPRRGTVLSGDVTALERNDDDSLHFVLTPDGESPRGPA